MELDNTSFEESNFNSNLEQNNSNLENDSLESSANGDPVKPPKKSNNGTLPVRTNPLNLEGPGSAFVKNNSKFIEQIRNRRIEQQNYIAKVNKYNTAINKVQSLGQGEQEVALNILKSKKLDLNDINSYDDKDFNTYINAKRQKIALEASTPYMKEAENLRRKSLDPYASFWDQTKAALGEQKALFQSWWNNEDKVTKTSKYKEAQNITRKYEIPIVEQDLKYSKERYKTAEEKFYQFNAMSHGMKAVKGADGKYKYVVDSNLANLSKSERDKYAREAGKYSSAMMLYRRNIDTSTGWINGENDFTTGFANEHGIPLLKTVSELSTNLEAVKAAKRVEAKKAKILAIKKQTGKDVPYVRDSDDDLVEALAARNKYDLTISSITEDGFGYRIGKGLAASIVFMEGLAVTSPVGTAATKGVQIGTKAAIDFALKTAIKTGLKKASEKAFAAEATNLTMRGLVQLGKESVEQAAIQTGKKGTLALMRSAIPSAKTIVPRLGGLTAQVGAMPATYKTGLNKYVSSNTALVDDVDGKTKLLIGQEKSKFLKEAIGDASLLDARIKALKAKGDNLTALEEQELYEKSDQLNKLAGTIEYIKNLGDNMSIGESLFYGGSETFKETFAEFATAGMLRTAGKLMGIGVRRAGAVPFLAKMGEKNATQNAKRVFSAVADNTYRPVGNFFNDFWKKGTDLGNKIYQKTGAGKMSQYLAFHSGDNKIFHSLGAEMAEEVHVALLPTYGQDYHENLEELQSANFYLDVLTQTLLMGGGMSGIGNTAHLYKMATDKKYRDNSRDLKDVTKNLKEFYKNLDENIDDVGLIEKIAFAAGHTEANVRDYLNRIEKAKIEGDKFTQQKYEKSFLQTLTARALRTGTVDEFKNTLQNMSQGDSISDTMKESIKYTQDNIGKYEDIAKKYGNLIQYGDIVNEVLNIDIAEANRKDLLKSLIDNKTKVQDSIEQFNMHENKGDAITYEDLENFDDNISRYNQLLEKKKKGVELEHFEKVQLEKLKHTITAADALLETFPHVAEQLTTLYVYNKYRDVSYESQKRFNHMIDPKNNAHYIQEYAKAINENLKDVVTPETAEEIKKKVNTNELDPVTNKKIDGEVIKQTQTSVENPKDEVKKEELPIKSNEEFKKSSEEMDTNIFGELHKIEQEKQKKKSSGDEKVKNKKSAPNAAQIQESQSLFDTPSPQETEGVVTEEQQLLSNLENVNFSPATYDKENKLHKTIIDNLAKIFAKDIANGYISFNQVLPSLLDGLGGAYVDTAFNLIVKAWEKASGVPLENAQKIYNQTFKNENLTELKNINVETVTIPEVGAQVIQAESSNNTEEDVKKQEETKEEIIKNDINEQIKVSTDNKIGEPLVKAAYLSLDYNREEETGNKSDATKTINDTSKPYIHPSNFQPGTQQRLEFDFDYLSNPDNNISQWSDIDDEHPTKTITTVKEFIEGIFGKGTYDDIVDKLKNEKTRGEVLANETLLKSIPTKFIINGVDVPGGINTHDWWNAENTLLPMNGGVPRPDLRRINIEEARILNLETRKLLAQNGHVMMTVEKIKEGYQNEISEEDKENKTFNSIENAFDNDIDAAVENVSFGLVGLNSSPQTHTINGIGVIKFGRNTILKEQIVNFEDWEKSHASTNGSSGKPFYIVKTGYKDSQNRDLYSIRSLVSNNENHQEAMKKQQKMIYEIIDLAKQYQQLKKEGKTIPDRLQNIYNNLKKFGIDLKDDSYNSRLSVYYPEQMVDKNRQPIKNEEGKVQYKQDYKVEKASSKHANSILDLTKYDTVQQFLRDIESGENLSSTTYKHILAKNMHTTYIYSEINDGINTGSVWTSEIQRVIQFDNSHLNAKKLEEEGVSKTSVNNVEKFDREIEAKNIEIKTLKRDIEEVEDEDLKDTFREELKEAEEKLERLETQKKVEENKLALEQREQKAAKTAVQETSGKQTQTTAAEESGVAEFPITDEKVFTALDFNDAVHTLYAKAIEKAGGNFSFNVEAVKQNLKSVFDDMVSELRNKNMNQEADFMEQNKDRMIGFTGEYRLGHSNYTNPNYEYSALEYIDAIFDVKHKEEYSDLEDDVEAQAVKENYDQESFQVNAIDNLSGKAKMLFAGIPDTRFAESGFGGFSKILPYNNSTEALQQILSEVDNNSLEEIEKSIDKKLKINNKEFGFYEHILNRLKELEKTNPEILKQILNMMYQPKTSMIMPLIEGKKVQVLDANSKNPSIEKLQNWKENFKNSPLITKGLRGTYTINKEVADRVYKLHSQFKEQGKESNLDDLREYLSYFGISLHPETLVKMYHNAFFATGKKLTLLENDGNGTVGILANNQLVDLLKANLDTALEQANQNKKLVFSSENVVNKNTYVEMHMLEKEITSAIRPLIQADNTISYTAMQSQYIAGKMVNSYEQPKLITNIVKKLTKEDPTYRNTLSKAAITSGSFTVEMLELYPEFREDFFDVVKISLEALKIKGDKSRDDAGITALSEKDKIVSNFGVFTENKGEIKNNYYNDEGLLLRKGHIAFPAMSDSSISPVLKTVMFNLTSSNVNADFNRLEDNVLDMLIDKMVRPELLRIAQYLKVNKNTNLEFFDNGAQIITSFESLNKVLLSDVSKGNEISRTLLELFTGNYENSSSYRDDIDAFIDKYKEELRNEISENINDVVDKYISEDGQEGRFVKNSLFYNGRIDENLFDVKYLKSKGKDLSDLQRARMMAYDYSVNFMLHQREIQTLFAGDIANYAKSKSLSKYNKNAILNKELTLDKIIEKNYRDLPKEEKEQIKQDIKTKEGLERIGELYPDLLSAYDIALNNVNEAYYDTNSALNDIFKDMFSEISNNLSKRLKGLVSPGNLFPNSKGGQKYYQIFLKDIDTVSDAIETFMDIHYPGKLEGSKKEIERLRELNRYLESGDTYDKNEKEYREREEEFETLRKKLSNEYPLIAGYFKNPSTDAQEYSTWRDNLNQLYTRGNVTKQEFDKIYAKLKAQEVDVIRDGFISEKNRWKEDEADLQRKAVMQPTKPLYSGIHHETFMNEDGNEFIGTRMIYIKSSSFPLLPEIMEKFPNLKNLANNLHSLEDVDEKTGEVKRTVRASYGSANKVGALSNPISMADMYNPDLLKDNKNFLAQYSTELDRENFFIQQDKPFKSDKNARAGKRDEVNIATQFEKIILGDGINKETRKIFDSKSFDKELIEEYNTANPDNKITPDNDKISGQDLYKIYNHIYGKLQAIYAEDLKREFGIENFSDMDKKSPESMQKLAEILNGKLSNKQAKQSVSLIYKVIINNRETNLNEDQYKRHLIEGGSKALEASFKVPLWLSPDSNKFQSVLGSMINKQFVNKKISGFSSPVASSEGFAIEGFDVNNKEHYKQLVNSGLIVTKNYNPSKGLQSVRNEDGTLKFAQVFIANKFKVYNSATGQYDYVDMSQYVNKETNILDTDKIPEDLLSMFSFRIPTSSHQSGTIIEIAGFLPHESADLMIVPSEHTTQIGEDYDIDTRYVYQYNLIKNKDGSVSKMKYEHLNISGGITYNQAKRDFNIAKADLWNKYFYTQINEGQNTIEHKFRATIKNDYWVSNQEKLYEIMFLEHALDNHYITNLSNVLLNTEYESEKDSIEGILPNNIIEDYKNRIKDLEEQLFSSRVLANRTKELKEEYREIKNKLREDSEVLFEKAKIYSNAISQKANEEKVLENNLISMYKSVFSTDNKEVQSLITKILSTDRAEDTANIIDKVIKESKGDKYFNIFSPHTQDEIMTLGAAGKIGIGEHSNAVTFNSILQQSAYEHKLQKEVTKYDQGLPYEVLEDYNIVLGNFIFDGVLGRTEMNGLRISELGMINQNSATDNQKLQIMAKRNENKHTMSVLKIMHAIGLDRELLSNGEPFMIDGKEISYASLFLAQPILRRYTELMDKFSSITDKSYGDVEENVKKQLLEEFGKGVDWVKTKKGEILTGVLNKDDLYHIGAELTGQSLYDSLAIKESEKTLKAKGGMFSNNTHQWYILQSFLDMKKAASDYGDMQKIINIEKDGMGVSYFNIINLKEKLFSLSNSSTNKITNAEKLIGDFIYTYEGKDENGNDIEIPEGYVSITDKKNPGRVLYIKPTTPQGHKIVNSVKAGYEMFSNLFPFEQGQVGDMINSLVRHREFKKENTKTEVELRQDSLNWMKDFLYTGNKTLFDGDVKAGSYDLFFDREGHDSLATYMSKLKANPKYRELFGKPFFKNLQFDLEFKDLPSIIKYVNNDISSIENLTVHNVIKTMINSDKKLEKRNGVEYTEADLIRDLFKYSILADQGKGAIGFRKVFDIDLFDNNGVSDSLRVYSNVKNSHLQNMLFNGPTKAVMNLTGTKILNNKIPIRNTDIDYLTRNLNFYNGYVKNRFDIDDMYTIDEKGQNIIVKHSTDDTDNAAFVRQVYQHNPQTVKTNIKKHIPSFGSHGLKESRMSKLLTENGYTVKDLDNNDVSSLIYKDKDENSPAFITLQDTNNKLRLFEHISNGFYEQIPTLGTFGFNEYEVATHRVKSLIPENNPKPYTGRVTTGIGVTRSMVSQPNTVQLRTLDNIINTILKDKQHPLRDILLTIEPHINRNNIDLAVVEDAPFKGVLGENKDEPGTYTIALNSKIFEENQYEVDKVIIEELLHYVTKTSFDKYIDIKNIDFKTGKINWSSINGMKTPAELTTLIAVYSNAIRHMAQKYGSEKMQEKYEEHKKSRDNKSPNTIEGQTLDIYRTTDFHEFLAGIFMKDEEFAKEMANTEYKGSKKTILEKFSDVLIRFLNRVLPNKRTDTISHEVAKTLHTFLLSKPKEKNVERKSKVADKIQEAREVIQEAKQVESKQMNVFGLLNEMEQKKKGKIAETSVTNPPQQQPTNNQENKPLENPLALIDILGDKNFNTIFKDSGIYIYSVYKENFEKGKELGYEGGDLADYVFGDTEPVTASILRETLDTMKDMGLNTDVEEIFYYDKEEKDINYTEALKILQPKIDNINPRVFNPGLGDLFSEEESQQQPSDSKINTDKNTPDYTEQNIFSLMDNMNNPSFSPNIKFERDKALLSIFKDGTGKKFEAMFGFKSSMYKHNTAPRVSISGNVVSIETSFANGQGLVKNKAFKGTDIVNKNGIVEFNITSEIKEKLNEITGYKNINTTDNLNTFVNPRKQC